MKRTSCFRLLVISCLFLVSSAALAVPSYLNYQGVLRDSSGSLITGTKAMKFRVYDAVTSGNKKFELTSSEVVVSGGLYNVMLGSLGFAEMGKGQRWLEVEVAGETLSPRIELVTVAYAVSAASAEAAEYAYLAGTATSATSSDAVDGFSASSTPTADTLFPLDSTGKISGVAISAEASASNYGLYVISGKIGAATSGAGLSSDPTIGAVGTATLLSASSFVDVYNSSVTNNSIILLTVGAAASGNNIALKVTSITAGSRFRVGTMDGLNPSSGANIPFSYLLIN